MTDVTQILGQIEDGDGGAAERLLALVYDELRRLAAAKLAQEKPGQSLQPTALVHEAYLRLVGAGPVQHFDGRSRFFAAAAEAMRRILVDRARRKERVSHGGKLKRIALEEDCAIREDRTWEILAVDEALSALAHEAPQKAELVKLRYFGGMSLQEAADVLGISVATARRHWSYAKAFLYCFLEGENFFQNPPEG
jgi:RNA polymerase sigma factor (TIGR02999 family)